MPFEAGGQGRRTVAVIGGGISGMGAAHALADTHDVTLFEAAPRLGGHARTVIAGKRGDQPVDTGFIVFNYANYPCLAGLFAELGVPVTESDMSFGASIGDGALEYGLAGAGAVFAQRRNIANPRFWGMLRDIFRFNAHALRESRDRRLTIRDFIAKMGLGDWFRDHYLLPLSGAIWSTPAERIMDFPAHALIQFFENHALLHHSGQHQWYTVQGGSASYVDRLDRTMRAKGVAIRTGAPVAGVRRRPLWAEVRAHGGAWEQFDEVVIASHSDDALRLLEDPAPEERAALGAVRYQPNDIVLHADSTVMPRRRAVWSSWNYAGGAGRGDAPIGITYWMNRLQPIPQDDPMFVTLNATRPIRDELVYDRVTMRHPVYDLAALEAQDRVRGFNGTRRTWFCGAWMRHGFHEDGLASGLEVAQALAARGTTPEMAAE
ncbi:NAD(P)/FAD-dependent oxidoreductase [Roseovarius salinarum]|uniref:NAD(P)/FAD-dependent oxidoreductase n=1 Tax=Roseovarius salinarum TaxID=1981892 RepID=UPI000C33D64B|nr:FAD-dependent oxidoreductase [Roseovarius salinarum]